MLVPVAEHGRRLINRLPVVNHDTLLDDV